MNLIRGPEPERRVSPIDSGPRTRVRAGLRRDQPRDWLEESGEHEGGEDFPRELARQVEEGPAASGPHAQEDEAPARLPEDRVEIHGLAAQAPPDEAPPAGHRLDVKV
ncbi:MAG: hypothetical protein WC326_07005 [Candidatus Delongbacteria bacterium]